MPRESTRTRRGNVVTSPSKNAVERRCRRCSGFPLLSQCEHTVAGRQFLEEQSKQQEQRSKGQKASPRCTVCEGRPLRSQCIHTGVGRVYLRQRDIAQQVDAELQGERASSTPGVPYGGATSGLTGIEDVVGRVRQYMEVVGQSGTPPSTTEVLLRQLMQGLEIPSLTPARQTEESSNQQVRSNPGLTFTGSSPRPRLTPADFTTSRRSHTPPVPSQRHSPVVGEITAAGTSHQYDHPNHLQSSHTPRSIPSRSESPQAEQSIGGMDAGGSDSPDPNIDPDLVSPPSPKKSTNTRATKSNPKYGFINGLMRGAFEYQIVRKHVRPEPIQDSTKASKRFLENIQRLAEKCDDLAASTGCWLFLGAQHVSGVSPTVHYTSPRLSRDAPEFMDEIINDFCRMIASLLQSRRSDALVLASKLKQTEEEKARLEASKAQAEEGLSRVEHEKILVEKEKEKALAENQELQALVQAYADMLGIRAGDRPPAGGLRTEAD